MTAPRALPKFGALAHAIDRFKRRAEDEMTEKAARESGNAVNAVWSRLQSPLVP